jgi:hypothetical protein
MSIQTADIMPFWSASAHGATFGRDRYRAANPAPKKQSACRFGGLKMPPAIRFAGVSGGTSIASVMEECGR